MKDIDDTKAPLLEHLIELRRRLLWSLAALIAAFAICFYFAKPIFAVLVQPLLQAGQGRLIFTDIFEAFFVEVKVALFAALLVCFPVFAIQIWKFVAPGLYAREKKALLPFLLLTPVFFGAGVAFAYFAAMPWDGVPGFLAKLAETDKTGEPVKLALEFLILTAARSGEMRGTRWSEIELDAKEWRLPAGRMKAGKAHTVPLSPRALAIT